MCIDANLLLRHREEQKLLVDHIRRTEDYVKQYKLLQVGLLKILQLLESNRGILTAAGHQLTDGFPRNESVIEAFAAIIENTCLFGDLVLHVPEMSAKILSKHETRWRPLLAWSMDFVSNYQAIVDETTTKMLSLFEQEINIERRNNDYVNPYYKTQMKDEDIVGKIQKKRRKLRKGPQLALGTGARRDEL